MFPMNVKASEQVAILGSVNPSSQAAGSAVSGWVSAANFNKFLAIIQAGAMTASGTLDANIQQAQDAAGTGAKAIGSGKAIAQILAASGGNLLAEINLDAQELDVNNGFGFIQLTVTTAVAASLTGGMLIGFLPRFGPASDFNAANVAQIV